MRLHIFHTTTYRYARQVAFGPHRVAISPRAGHDLRVLSAELICEPVAELRETEDVFGNKVTIATFAAAADHLVIANRLEVVSTASEWPIFRIAVEAQTFPFHYTMDEATDLGALREPCGSNTEVGRWARSFVDGEATDTLGLLNALNGALHRDIQYRSREEAGTQAPHETLAMRSGSCRDIAALFIEAARQLGFGARAVSGYLYDPQADPLDDGTTHAWAEIYLPEAGWITFDPTHGRLGSANLIPTAVGRRNDQIMPILGSFIGAYGDFLGLDVRVDITRATS